MMSDYFMSIRPRKTKLKAAPTTMSSFRKNRTIDCKSSIKMS